MNSQRALRFAAIGGKAMISVVGLPLVFLIVALASMGDCLGPDGDVGSCGGPDLVSGVVLAVIALLPIVAAVIPFATRLWVALPIYAITGSACVLGAVGAAITAARDSSSWPFLISAYLFATAFGLAAAAIYSRRHAANAAGSGAILP